MKIRPALQLLRAASSAFLALWASASAAAVTLAWDPNPETDLAGYNVYYGPLNGVAQTVPVQTTTMAVTNLAPGGIYFFYVTALNTAGLESLPSETLLYTNLSAVNVSWAASRAFGATGYRLVYGAGAQTTTLDTGAARGATLSLLPGQTYHYTVLAYNALGLVVDTYATVTSAGSQVAAPAPASPNNAEFLLADSTTRGFWQGSYGSEGRQIVADSTVLPAWANVSAVGGKEFVWTALTTWDSRALANSELTGFVAACWYSPTYFDLNVTLSDGRPHIVSLYCASHSLDTRAQRIDVYDPATGTLLSSRDLSDFRNGQYLSWEVSGAVTFRVTRTGAANAVVSGVFIDPVPTVPEARFLGADTATRGNWKGVYGTAGYAIAGDSVETAAGTETGLIAAQSWVWNPASASGSALQKSALQGRIAACWYSPGEFSIRVNFADTDLHEVSLYCWDSTGSGRSQRVEVVEPRTGIVLHSYDLADFSAGVYLSWNVKGTVDLRVTNTGPWNGVVSGLFFDPAE